MVGPVVFGCVVVLSLLVVMTLDIRRDAEQDLDRLWL